MNAVIWGIVLTVLLSAQPPLLPAPDLPNSPVPVPPSAPDLGIPEVPLPKEMSNAPGFPDPKEMSKLPPPVPQPQPSVVAPKELVSPASHVEESKPPPFRLIETPSAVDPAPLVAPPNLTTDPLPASGVVTPCLLLSRYGPPNIRAGQPFTYEIVARNAGSLAVAQVKLEEELPPGTKIITAQPTALAQGERLTWILENLAPGAERHFKVEVEASREGEWQATATLSVTAKATMKSTVAGPSPRSADVPSAAAVPFPNIADPSPRSADVPPAAFPNAAPSTQPAVTALSITGPGSLPVGHPVVFQLRVTNTTGAPLTNAIVRVQMASGLQHLQGDAIEGPLGDLAPGQSKELTLEAITLRTGSLVADALLLSGKKVLAAAQVTVVATEQPTLVLRQTGPLTPAVGGEHEFKVEVTNRTAIDVRDAVVSDLLPEGLQFVSGDAGAHYDAATRTVRWNLGTLPPGQPRQLMFRARVRGAGPQVNQISARAAGVAQAQLYTILRLGGSR